MYYQLTDAEIRNVCKEKLESLEYWLRRLIDEVLTAEYGDYFNHQDASGNRIIRNASVIEFQKRIDGEPGRYPRLVDAMLLDDAVNIITNPTLYNRHFSDFLKEAFPEGREEARTFMKRLIDARNPLYHANTISTRKAEQVICYSNDIIDSIKNQYTRKGMDNDYNVPLILKVTDSFGNVYHRAHMDVLHDGGVIKNFTADAAFYLRVGDVLTLELEIDPSFDERDYSITWGSAKGLPPCDTASKKLVIQITDKQVAQSFDIQCQILSNKEWHRMSMGADDLLIFNYKVLPPPS